MAKNSKKYSLQEVADIVENEGLDYAITSYLCPDSIEDVKLRKLWLEAGVALRTIEAMLEVYY